MISNMNPQVRVGVGIFIFKDGKFLLMQRKGSHGSDTWALPGGHLEYGETFEEAGKREVKEETDLDIKNVQFAAALNDIFEEKNKHYVSIWLTSEWDGGIEKIIEPDKCQKIGWYDFETMPQPLFMPWKQFMESEFYEMVNNKLKSTQKI